MYEKDHYVRDLPEKEACNQENAPASSTTLRMLEAPQRSTKITEAMRAVQVCIGEVKGSQEEIPQFLIFFGSDGKWP